ncbi:hypothetical protein RCL1_007369 [Eukaryota sp. TZLM3-RCL]
MLKMFVNLRQQNARSHKFKSSLEISDVTLVCEQSGIYSSKISTSHKSTVTRKNNCPFAVFLKKARKSQTVSIVLNKSNFVHSHDGVIAGAISRVRNQNLVHNEEVQGIAQAMLHAMIPAGEIVGALRKKCTGLENSTKDIHNYRTQLYKRNTFIKKTVEDMLTEMVSEFLIDVNWTNSKISHILLISKKKS